MSLIIDPRKLDTIADRWSEISPEEGTEECICMLCGKMIGAHENDPRWEDHDSEWCAGCELCEIAIRIWNEPAEQILIKGSPPLGPGDEVKEMRFHPKCFAQVLAPRREE